MRTSGLVEPVSNVDYCAVLAAPDRVSGGVVLLDPAILAKLECELVHHHSYIKRRTIGALTRGAPCVNRQYQPGSIASDC
jgi:hypothetical protein